MTSISNRQLATGPLESSLKHGVTTTKAVAEYARGIWRARFSWAHLALPNMRSRWCRSLLGIPCIIVQPLGLTLIVSIVFGKLFRTDISAYAPYILSGLIVCCFVMASAIGGSCNYAGLMAAAPAKPDEFSALQSTMDRPDLFRERQNITLAIAVGRVCVQ